MQRPTKVSEGRQPPEEYADAFARVQEHLHAGNSYEVNLTHRLSRESDLDPVTAYLRLRELNPAPYSGFLQHDVDGARAWLLSSSPERYALVTADRHLETKPIKGTTPRGATAEEDEHHRERLARDPKTRAENLMIVDLLRNDLSMVCEVGSVEVPVLMEVESYESVHQLVSTVRGRLRDDVSTVAALRALFPAGSMTGAPKLRTMEIIEEVESSPRGAYAGAFGWISGDGPADLGVVIRSLMTDGSGTWTLGTGGGITVKSDVAEEWAESEWKAERLLRVFDVTPGRALLSRRYGTRRSRRRHRANRAPPPGASVDLELAAVAVDHLAHDGQAEARAGHRPRLLGAVEALEDVRPVGLGDARALVVDGEHPVGQPHEDGALRRAPLGGVVEQVGDRPLEAAGVADDPPRVEVDVEGHALRATAYARHRPLDDVGEVHLGDHPGRGLVARELDEVADERAELLDLAADVVEQLEPGARPAVPCCPRPGGAGRGWCAAT